MCRTTPISRSRVPAETALARRRRGGRPASATGTPGESRWSVADVVLDVAEPRPPLAGERVVDAVGEAREREQRMRRAAAAEVDLERVRLPARRPCGRRRSRPRRGRSRPRARAAARPSAPRPRSAPRTPGRPGSGSRSTSGRAAPPSTWSCVDMMSTWPAGLMRSWTLGLRKSSPSIRSSTMPPSLVERARGTARRRAPSSSSSIAARRSRRAASRSTQRVAEPAHAVVELEDGRRGRRAAAREARRARRRGRPSPSTSSPTGCGTSSSANTRRLPVFEPSQSSAGSQP